MEVEKEEKPSHINIFSSEIVGQVLRELSVVDRLQCEGVNRRWKAITWELGWTEQKELSIEIVFQGATKSQKEKFNTESFITLFRRVAANLTVLDLKQFPKCSIYSSQYGINIFGWLDFLPNLAKLDVRGINFRDVVYFLRPTLFELHSSGPFDKHNLEALSLKCPNLKLIDFYHYNNPGSKLPIHVMNEFFGKCQNLETIYLVGNFIESTQNTSLTALGQLECLEELYLDSVEAFGDSALKALIAGCPRLRKLKIDNIAVTNEAVSELDQHPNLVDFELINHPELDGDIERKINERWKIKRYNYLRSRMPTDDSVSREMLKIITSEFAEFEYLHSDLRKTERPFINELIQRGFLPLLIKSLGSTIMELQYEAVALLARRPKSSIDNQISAIVEAGAVPELLKLLNSERKDICVKSLVNLRNIVGDRIDFRDLCVDLGIIELLVKMLETEKSIKILRYIAEIFQKMCSLRTPPLALDIVMTILPILGELIRNSNISVLETTIWALSDIADCGNERIQHIVDLGVIPRLLSLVDHAEEDIRIAALDALSRIALGTDEQKQLLLDSGALKKVPEFFTLCEDGIVEGSVRFLANIACDEKWVQIVRDTELVPVIIQFLYRGEELQQEAMRVISNIAKYGRSEHIHYLVDFGVTSTFCKLISDNDYAYLFQNILVGLKNILEKSDTRSKEICDKIKRFKGLNEIRNLQNHENENINMVAGEIIEKYFSAE